MEAISQEGKGLPSLMIVMCRMYGLRQFLPHAGCATEFKKLPNTVTN